MSTLVQLRTVDGRVIQGINYTVNPGTLPGSISGLVAAMPGGMQQGVYHIQTQYGWEYIPASQIVGFAVKAGAPT